MKCPVCKNDIDNLALICEFCGFDDLQKTFINAEDVSEWMDNVVIPYRKIVMEKSCEDTERLYNEIFDKQFASIARHIDKDISEFEYVIKDDGIVLTQYHGINENEIVIPSHIQGVAVYRLENGLFSNCSSLCKISLPHTLTEIGASVFSNTSLNELVLPKSLKLLGANAFEKTRIKSIIIPENVKYIPAHLFGNFHEYIHTVVLLGAREIGPMSLSHRHLSQLALSDSLEEIGFRALEFAGLKKLIFPPKLKLIKAGNIPRNAHIAFLSDTVEIQWHTAIRSEVDRPHATFYCNQGSTAQVFARKYGLPYYPLSQFPQ